jgi:hypothetical protein
MTGATSGAGIAYPSGAPEFTTGCKWDYSIISKLYDRKDVFSFLQNMFFFIEIQF